MFFSLPTAFHESAMFSSLFEIEILKHSAVISLVFT